jgi:hypothetical protein
MKKIILLLATISFLSMLSYAQAPNWLWAKSAGGTDFDFAKSVAVDANGNTYVSGFFSSPSITFGTNTLTNAGSRDMFLAKYDAIGNVVWAKSAGGANDDEMRSVKVDANGNTYVTGWFSSPTIAFGSNTLTNLGYRDIFIAKYDATGNVVWAKSAGGTGDDAAGSFSKDATGNIYLAGYYESPTLIFGSTTLTNAGYGDIFLAKYDTVGNVVWAKSAGGTGLDGAGSFSMDASGNIYLAGYYESPTLIFGSTNLTNAGSGDIFLVKYDAAGNVIWAKSAGGTGLDEAVSIAVDAYGNNYLAGYFSSFNLIFDSAILTSTGSEDIFLAKYNAAGNVVWAIRAGGNGDDKAYSVAVDASGNIYLAGSFLSSTLIFGSTTLMNMGYEDIFLAKYDTDGNVFWAKSTGGNGNDYLNSVVVDVFGNTYVTGLFCSPTMVFGTTTLTNVGFCDIFLGKLNNDVGINEFHKPNSISIYPNPSSDKLIIDFQSINDLKNITVSIYNIQGKLLLQQAIKQTQIEINISSFAKGVYIIKVYNDNNIMVSKFIKE